MLPREGCTARWGGVGHPTVGCEQVRLRPEAPPLSLCIVRLHQGDIAQDGKCPGWKAVCFSICQLLLLSGLIVSASVGEVTRITGCRGQSWGFPTAPPTDEAGFYPREGLALSRCQSQSSSAHALGASHEKVFSSLHHCPPQGQAQALTATQV